MANTRRTFLGNFRVSIDSKQRVAIPASLRETLSRSFPEEADRVIVTAATADDGAESIAVYPVSSFNTYMEQLESLSELNADGQTLLVYLSSSARECQIDKQGRIRLPEDLLRTAGLEKEAVFCGHVSRMQIWNPERHADFMGSARKSLPETRRNAGKALNRT